MNLEKESSEHLKWTHLEQVQHCIDLPLQVTFTAHTEHGKDIGMNVAAHQEEQNKKKGKRKAGEERKQLSDFKRLRAILLRWFRGQHGEKMVCVRGVPGVTGILDKANSHFDPT